MGSQNTECNPILANASLNFLPGAQMLRFVVSLALVASSDAFGVITSHRNAGNPRSSMRQTSCVRAGVQPRSSEELYTRNTRTLCPHRQCVFASTAGATGRLYARQTPSSEVGRKDVLKGLAGAAVFTLGLGLPG